MDVREQPPVATGYPRQPLSPLAGGLLTGKYRPGEPPPPGTRAYNNPNMQRQLTEQNLRIVARLSEFAQARGHTVGELALAWLAAHPVMPSPQRSRARPMASWASPVVARSTRCSPAGSSR
ncbi:MAG: aldo/keto reductase [Chloroflexi bacterium]|nr:aldo/keto reductase [Chloroflexota bacterium]